MLGGFIVSVAFSVLAYWFYIHRQAAYNAFILPPLPDSYYIGSGQTCKVIHHNESENLRYCEDLAAWRTRDDNGKAVSRVIASCDPGRYEWNTVMGPLLNPDTRGGLWLIYTDTPQPHAQLLPIEGFPQDNDFHPLGIDVLPAETEGSPSTVFVVNHQRHARTIDIFSLYSSPPRLVYARQLDHPALWAPNSVAALSPNELFVSIDHWFTRGGAWPWRLFMHTVESVLSLPLGRVLHLSFNSTDIQVSTAFKYLSFPNGISLSPEKSELAVASTTAGEVQLYEVKQGGKLVWKTTVPLPHLPDNLHYQEDGSLLVAGHPHFRSIARLAKKKQTTSPTWLVSVSERSGTTGDDIEAPYSAYNRAERHSDFGLSTIYQSNGFDWSAGTSAVWTNDKLVMTGLYTRGIMIC